MVKNLRCPPPLGSLKLELPLHPVSFQSKSNAKSELKSKIHTYLSEVEFYFSGEVEIDIAWYLHEKERYQGVHSPDIDNILEPLIDAISGVGGVLINDCQVQSVRCSWIDWLSEQHKLDVEIRYQADDWIKKKNLVWVEISEKLCMPLNSGLEPEKQLMFLNTWEKIFSIRTQIFDVTGKWELGQLTMPIQTPFHRARLQEFNIHSLSDIKDKLNQMI